MILFINTDRKLTLFSNYDFAKGEYLYLQGDVTSYLLHSEDLYQKMTFGDKFTGKLPIVYDCSHGDPTEERLQKYGISVEISALAGKEKEQHCLQSLFALAQTSQKYSLKIAH